MIRLLHHQFFKRFFSGLSLGRGSRQGGVSWWKRPAGPDLLKAQCPARAHVHCPPRRRRENVRQIQPAAHPTANLRRLTAPPPSQGRRLTNRGSAARAPNLPSLEGKSKRTGFVVSVASENPVRHFHREGDRGDRASGGGVPPGSD